MYPDYDDILEVASKPPLWWDKGVPRFRTFTPHDVYPATQVALVHTKCQDCRTRYDIAVTSAFLGNNLRDLLAFYRELGVGDPPNACGYPPIPRTLNCTGRVMNSLEIEILEFW